MSKVFKRGTSVPNFSCSNEDIPNWKYPGDTDEEDLSCTDKSNDLDDSLTSLNWLHTMQSIKLEPQMQSLYTVPEEKPAKPASTKPPSVQRNRQPKSANTRTNSAVNSTGGGSTKTSSTAPRQQHPKCTFIHGSSNSIPFGLQQNGYTRQSGNNAFVPALLSRHSSMQNNTDVSATSVFPLCGVSPGSFETDMYSMSFGCNKTSDAAQLLEDPDVAKYKYNHLIKPPFSYPTLICMAVKAKLPTQDGQISLNEIYEWIADNFSYYKHADPTWQNNIKHNLSLNKCFEKVCLRLSDATTGKQQQEDPKTSYWRVAAAHKPEIESMFKKRRQPVAQTLATNPPKKPRYAAAGPPVSGNGGAPAHCQSAPAARSKRKQTVPELIKRTNSTPARHMSHNHQQQQHNSRVVCSQYNEDAAKILESHSPLLSDTTAKRGVPPSTAGGAGQPRNAHGYSHLTTPTYLEDCYLGCQDTMVSDATDEDKLMSQIDDLFFDISPPASSNLNDEILSPSCKEVEDFLSVHGSRIDPPTTWTFNSKVKVEPLPDAATSWLECSQNSLSFSNNSDWLRDSHERIMAGGQLSDEDSGYAAGGFDGESPCLEIKLESLEDYHTSLPQFNESLNDLFDFDSLPEPLA